MLMHMDMAQPPMEASEFTSWHQENAETGKRVWNMHKQVLNLPMDYLKVCHLIFKYLGEFPGHYIDL
jgi:hypothetical protein